MRSWTWGAALACAVLAGCDGESAGGDSGGAGASGAAPAVERLAGEPFVQAVTAAATPCDQALEGFSTYAKGSGATPEGAAAAAQTAVAACRTTTRTLETMTVAESAEAAQAACLDAYRSKTGMAETALRIDYNSSDMSWMEPFQQQRAATETKLQACFAAAQTARSQG